MPANCAANTPRRLRLSLQTRYQHTTITSLTSTSKHRETLTASKKLIPGPDAGFNPAVIVPLAILRSRNTSKAIDSYNVQREYFSPQTYMYSRKHVPELNLLHMNIAFQDGNHVYRTLPLERWILDLTSNIY
jgi:hypothetical protein